MAREYPRFLFSDPRNTKSKGPFIIHTLFPRAIFKIDRFGLNPRIIKLEIWDKCDDDEERRLCTDTLRWLSSQSTEPNKIASFVGGPLDGTFKKIPKDDTEHIVYTQIKKSGIPLQDSPLVPLKYIEHPADSGIFIPAK